MTPTRFLRISLIVCLLAAAEARAGASFVHTFFEGTQYPLTVHFISGDEPGPTIFIQGGIQGDEASGFLTAQALTRAKVSKGALIVVPRANLPSINARQRQVNVDLNRRFDKDYNQFYEDRLARVIRHLVSQSQAVIHLHEGSGFYRAERVDDQHGPKRYGQSVIIDTSVYKDRIFLAKAVSEALREINAGVVNKDYVFTLFNMNTLSDATPYLEQRKSLTYYALCGVGIPAMAVEVSKNIPDLGWKVAQQLRVTAILAKRFGVEMSVPAPRPEDLKAYPKDKITVLVNGQAVTGARQFLALDQGKPVKVSFEHKSGDGQLAPAPSVFASDRPGVNLAQTPRLPLAPFKNLDIRADGMKLATAELVWKGSWHKHVPGRTVFACWLNGELRTVSAGGTLEAVRGDQLILEGVIGGGPGDIINFKGFVTQRDNPSQDAGQEIILDPSQFIKKFLLPPAAPGETMCEVVWETGKPHPPSFRIRIKQREVYALHVENLERGSFHDLVIGGAAKLSLRPGKYRLADIYSNGRQDKVQLLLGGRPVRPGDVFTVSASHASPLAIRLATTFEKLGETTLAAADDPREPVLAEADGAYPGDQTAALAGL